MTIGSDGHPIIAYTDGINDDLKVAHCNDNTCTNPGIAAVDTSGDVGFSPSIAIGSDGLPIITYGSYSDGSPFPYNVKASHCNNLDCTRASNVYILLPINSWSNEVITIGVDGLPLIILDRFWSDGDDIFFDITVLHCSNVFCVPNWRR